MYVMYNTDILDAYLLKSTDTHTLSEEKSRFITEFAAIIFYVKFLLSWIPTQASNSEHISISGWRFFQKYICLPFYNQRPFYDAFYIKCYGLNLTNKQRWVFKYR